MIRTICFILCLFSADTNGHALGPHNGWIRHAQDDTLAPGIYIMTTPHRKVACTNEARMIISNHKICISKKPIIAVDELTYATEIQYDPKFQMHYIDIGLSPAGSHVLSQTIKSLPDIRFALALEGQVVCVFRADPSIAVRSFRIGSDVTLKDLTAIHEVLKNVKFN